MPTFYPAGSGLACSSHRLIVVLQVHSTWLVHLSRTSKIEPSAGARGWRSHWSCCCCCHRLPPAALTSPPTRSSCCLPLAPVRADATSSFVRCWNDRDKHRLKYGESSRQTAILISLKLIRLPHIASPPVVTHKRVLIVHDLRKKQKKPTTGKRMEFDAERLEVVCLQRNPLKFILVARQPKSRSDTREIWHSKRHTFPWDSPTSLRDCWNAMSDEWGS
jgi:hypothetical protein